MSLVLADASSGITDTCQYACAWCRISLRRYSVSWGADSPGWPRAMAYVVGGFGMGVFLFLQHGNSC